MFFSYKHIYTTIILGGTLLFNACAPESKYNGGSGALRSYESTDAYNSNTIKYRQDYTQPAQSSFSSALVANDRDNIRQTPQNNRSTQQYIANKKNPKNTQYTQKSQANVTYESPVKGDGSFTPTQSLLGGMRESEAIQRATMRPYTVRGKTYRPHPVKVGDTFDGIASWYGPDFHAKATSNGETYNMYAHTAAHKTFPMNTIVKVYNKDNGKSTVVRINDRGPFVEGRIIDLSNVAAHDIAMVSKGIANVRIEVVGFGGDLVNNTPPKDSTSQTISQQVTQKQTKSTVANLHTQKEEQTTQQPQNTILKPKKETQVTRTEDTLGKDSASINQSNNIQTKQTHNNTNIASIQDSKTQDKIPHNTPTNNPNSKSEAVDSTPLVISEEELPDFDEETKDETKEIQTKTQPEEPTTPESATSNITPKYIDNTESIKDIDDAMQRLKDSTENLARNARNELKDQVKEDALNKQQETTMTTKIENVDSQNHNNKDSKMTDSNHAKKGNFMVSLNVFSDENRAKSFKNDNLNIIKDTNYSIDIVLTDKGYRVALRGFETYDEAKSFITKHDIKGYVTQEIK